MTKDTTMDKCKHCDGFGYRVDDERARIPCEACGETGKHIECVSCGEQVDPYFADAQGRRCDYCAREAEESDHREYVAQMGRVV